MSSPALLPIPVSIYGNNDSELHDGMIVWTVSQSGVEAVSKKRGAENFQQGNLFCDDLILLSRLKMHILINIYLYAWYIQHMHACMCEVFLG